MDLTQWGWGLINTSSNFEYATTFTLDIAGGKNVIVFDEGNYEIITSADNGAKITLLKLNVTVISS